MARKKRSDAVLAHLPLEQQRELCEWLLSGTSYEACRVELESRFGVTTSTGALHDFYHDFVTPELLRRRASAVSTAEELAKEAESNPGEWDAAAIEALKMRVADMMARPGSDPKEIKALFDLMLKSRKLDAEERRIALLEQKAARLDELEGKAKAGRDSGMLTPETLEFIERELKLL